MNNHKELTIDDLNTLLLDNEINNFDPVQEAFKIYDPEETGNVDQDKLREIFAAFGFGELTEEELGILMKTADVDNDGKVSLNDFRSLAMNDQGNT